MKKSYKYDTWINKLMTICHYQKASPIKKNENKELNPMAKSHKMTEEEMKDFRMMNKQQKLIDLRESYVNEDKRKERIDTIVKKRLQKS